MTESLIAKRINMLEKGREEHTFNNVWSREGRNMFFDKDTNKVTKLKLITINFLFFFLEMSQINYQKKKCVASIVVFPRSFLLVLGFFYILTYCFYQILGNVPLIVKLHHKNTLFLSTITKQYFFFCNLYHYSITEFSTSIKHINKISNYAVI